MTLSRDSARLSRRAEQLKASSTLAVTARVRELKAAGVDVIAFGAGEPDFDTPQPIKQAAIDAMLDGATRYSPIPGTPEARKVIAEKLNRENGIRCSPEDIVITTGGKHALYLAAQAVIDDGDEVIIPTPGWVSYVPIVQLCGGVPVEVPASVDNDFRITPEQLERAITPRTRAMIFNSPSNPCGTTYEPNHVRALAEVLARHEQIMLFSDEIYEKLIYADFAHLSPGSIESIADRVITLNGLSKAYAMTGWRIGYACAPAGGKDDNPLAKAMARLQGQMTTHIASFGYAAIVEALSNGAEAVESMRRTFARRAERMYALVSAMPGFKCPRPTGAFYIFIDVSDHFGRTSPGGKRIESGLTFAGALLEEANVAVVPGEDFGEGCDKNIRLSFACSDENIDEGCRRIDDWLGMLS
ncbi:MAG: pyridoxal phosphate-dependent aminotransferase [Phycisphaerales bacterium]|nr:MAG: pyridoxal phosphate-dependent aminotransferase [Phycisphaerales bacterium]